MGILNRGAQLQASASDWQRVLTPPPAPVHTIGLGDVAGLVGGVFGLDTAMMVPAFARGIKLISGVIAGLPLVDLDPATGQKLPPQGLTSRQSMCPGMPDVTLMRSTAVQLVAWGEAFWRVTAVDGFDWPTAVELLDHDRVSADGASWMVDGITAPRKGQGRVIHFDTGAPGALQNGWETLSTALSLELAARNYADAPQPTVVLQSMGLDLDEDEADEMLSKWALARRRRTTAYLNSQVKAEAFGFSAAEVQLIEMRQYSAMEIARLLELDGYWVGAVTPNSSITYSNEQDRRAALLDFTITPFARVIEQRLSMDDVTGGGRVLRFDTMGFLRANLGERVAAFTAYTAAGILTLDEARALEPLVQAGDVPA